MTTTPVPLRLLMVTPRFLPESGGVETHGYRGGPATGARRRGRDRSDHRSLRDAPARSDGGDRRGAGAGISAALGHLPRHPGWTRDRTARRRRSVHVQSYHSLVAPAAMIGARRSTDPRQLSRFTAVAAPGRCDDACGRRGVLLKPLLERAAKLIAVSAFGARAFSDGLGLARQVGDRTERGGAAGGGRWAGRFPGRRRRGGRLWGRGH